MANQNRLGWKAVDMCDGTWRVYNRYNAPEYIGGMDRRYPSQQAAEQAIADEIARRDRRNTKSRDRHSLMTSLGLTRTRSGSYE